MADIHHFTKPGPDAAEIAAADADYHQQAGEQDSQPGHASGRRVLNLRDYGAERLVGPAPATQWLVEGSIPLGVAGVIAAMGDTGKSFIALQLCQRVSAEPLGNLDFNLPILGGRVAAHGTAVFITAEDSEAAVHRRLETIDPQERRRDRPGKLITVSLPDAGGPMPLFVNDPRSGVRATDEFDMICDQLAALDDLKLVVFDPLAAFALVGLDNASAEVQFVAGQLGALAAQTGATVLVLHHMRKGAEPPKTVSEARERIRGASAIVDGVRVAYALWPQDERDARKVCRTLEVPFLLNRIVSGAVVKANDQASREIATYVRTDQGLLLDRTSDLKSRRPGQEALADDLVAAVAAQALAGHPFTLRGQPGLYQQRERLPEALRAFGRDRLENFCRDLIDSHRIVQCSAKGAHHGKWLDVPGGPFALGTGEFELGAAS